MHRSMDWVRIAQPNSAARARWSDQKQPQVVAKGAPDGFYGAPRLARTESA